MIFLKLEIAYEIMTLTSILFKNELTATLVGYFIPKMIH